ncbi:MAG: hypothetical protein HY403_04040 [Elusimicrobia bacterium]|nr:hypothetical protein [Elusimicrobiota bacterium]
MSKKIATRPRPASDEASGTYKYDRALGRMVKVSGRVPGLRKGGRGGSAPEPPCGRGACGGGRCAA